jgi:hypothetical protein
MQLVAEEQQAVEAHRRIGTRYSLKLKFVIRQKHLDGCIWRLTWAFLALKDNSWNCPSVDSNAVDIALAVVLDALLASTAGDSVV